jgi:nicotinamidase-related amidase
MLLTADDAVLLLIDLQQRLMPVIHDQETVVARAVRLAEAARLMDVPVIATEQNPAGLGPTVPPLSAYPRKVLAKTAFSAAGEPGLAALLPAVEGGPASPGGPASAGGSRREIIVAGCEAHICVLQTVLDLLARGHRVAVAADAVGSRDPADRSAALDRARQHGAEIVTSEMVLFEWLRDSQHPRFREVQKLLK